MIQRACWSDKQAIHILKPDAEEIADHVFRFVHCPSELQIADTATGNRIPEDPEVLISRFLDPNKNYVQAVVLGESGTGKSHLIQWLRLNIPEDENTVLLTIPKTGTSLRGIVERLIDRLPIENRSIFEERLSGTGSYTTSKEAKISKLLESLAWVIEHGDIANTEDVDLSTLLPDILRDPNLRREFFLCSGKTTEAIVEHIFIDPEDRDGNEERREFSLGDLPLDGSAYKNASKRAQEAIDYILGESRMNERSIALMNRALDAAITQTLNFSADNLIDLMNTLRRFLAGQGKRLILLIEDFARLQGIDTALLQALITPPTQGADRLCEIRWAMAVTTGYFERLEKTVRTRTTFVVDMDRSRPTSLAKWTSGYLNALRFGDKQLREFSKLDENPSFCTTCAKRVSCFSAFGEVQGVGLFPFTETAINVMAARSDSLIDEKFNPRQFLRIVLDNVLVGNFRDIEIGEFPSEKLLQKIGGKNRLSTLDLLELEKRDEANFLRRKTLLELWQGEGKIANLVEGLHEAFGIPLLKDLATAKASTLTTSDSIKPKPEASIEIPSDIAILRAWAVNGSILPQNFVQNLRELIYSALDSYIDWDELGFKKSTIASATAGTQVFKKVSINFVNQQTQSNNTFVSLEISPDSKLVAALEALLFHKLYENWTFEGGPELFAYLLEALNVWSESISQQIKNFYNGKDDWNPIIACSELLLVATLQSGKVKMGDTNMDSVVAKMWDAAPPRPLQLLDQNFSKINNRLVSDWPKLISLLRAISSGTKGGQAGNFIRITPILKGMRSLRQSSLQLSQSPPTELLPKDLKDLAELYRTVQCDLANSIADEKQNWLQWLSTLEIVLPKQVSIVKLIESIKTAINTTMDSGVSVAGTKGRLESILNEITPAALERGLEHARALESSNNSDSLVRLALVGETMRQINELVDLTDKFVSQVKAAVENETAALEQRNSSGLRESELIIEQSLDQLAELIGELHSSGGVQ